MSVKPAVFIDGEAGTTGLQIYQRLTPRDDLERVSIDPAQRKDAAARSRLMNEVDVVILCLPDAAAQEAVGFVTNPRVKILDASSVHRTAAGWVYGFPELEKTRRAEIAAAQRVSNPGCYPTGFLACVRPLVAAGLIPATMPITVNAVSGYSGGGKQLIATYEATHGGSTSRYPYGIYGLGFGHKHVAEMHKHSGLAAAPLFVPAVGDFMQGMLVQVPLPLWSLNHPPSGSQLASVLQDYYADEAFVQVSPYADITALRDGKFLDAQAANGSNRVELFVFGSDDTQEALLVARLDNLGKGASGAAVQNLNLMLGLPEVAGLEGGIVT